MAGLNFAVAVLDHGGKNKMACFEGFAAVEGIYCLWQFPLSCAAMAVAQRGYLRGRVSYRAKGA